MPVKKTRSRRTTKPESPPASSDDNENDCEEQSKKSNEKNKTYERRSTSEQATDALPPAAAAKTRSSPRLKRLREKHDNDDEEEEEEDEEESVVSNRNRKDKKSKSQSKKQARLKSPPAKKRRTVPLYRKQCTPKFVGDDELLLELGVAYTSKKQKKTRILYHESVEVDGEAFAYPKNGKYELLRVRAHKIAFEAPREACADSRTAEWYKNVQVKKLRRFIARHHRGRMEHSDHDDCEMKNEDEEDDGDDDEAGDGSGAKAAAEETEQDEEEEEADPMLFGELVFECEWRGWPRTTWEDWAALRDNVVFEEYCAAHKWDMDKPMQCRLEAHSPQDIKRILLNMAIFGDHYTRKAMKILLCNNMNVW